MSDLYLLARHSDYTVATSNRRVIQYHQEQQHQQEQQNQQQQNQQQNQQQHEQSSDDNNDTTNQRLHSSIQTTTSSATILHRNHNSDTSMLQQQQYLHQLSSFDSMNHNQQQQYLHQLSSFDSMNHNHNSNTIITHPNNIFDSIRSTLSTSSSNILGQQEQEQQISSSIKSHSPPPNLLLPMGDNNNINKTDKTSNKRILWNNANNIETRKQQQPQQQQRRCIFDNKVQKKYHTSGTTSHEDAMKIREMIAQLWSPNDSNNFIMNQQDQHQQQKQKQQHFDPPTALVLDNDNNDYNFMNDQQQQQHFDDGGLESRRNSWNEIIDIDNVYDNDNNYMNINKEINTYHHQEQQVQQQQNHDDINNNNHSNNDIPAFYNTSYYYNPELEKDFVKWTPSYMSSNDDMMPSLTTTTTTTTTTSEQQEEFIKVTDSGTAPISSEDITTTTAINPTTMPINSGYRQPIIVVDNESNSDNNQLTVIQTPSVKNTTMPILPLRTGGPISATDIIPDQHLLSTAAIPFLSPESPRICWQKQQQQLNQLSSDHIQNKTPSSLTITTTSQHTKRDDDDPTSTRTTRTLSNNNDNNKSSSNSQRRRSPRTSGIGCIGGNNHSNHSHSHHHDQIVISPHETIHAQSLLLGITFLAVWTSSNMMAPNLTYMSYDYHMKNDKERDMFLGSYCSIASSVLSLPISALIGMSTDLFIGNNNNNNNNEASNNNISSELVSKHQFDDMTNTQRRCHFKFCNIISTMISSCCISIPSLLNRKMIFIITCLLSGISCICTAYTMNYYQLLLCRLLNGGFQSGTVPIIFSLLSDLFDVNERNTACSGFTAMMGLGIIGGQVYAGSMVGIDHRRTFPYKQQHQQQSSSSLSQLSNIMNNTMTSHAHYDVDYNYSNINHLKNKTYDFGNLTSRSNVMSIASLAITSSLTADASGDNDSYHMNKNIFSILFFESPTGWAHAFIVSGWFTIICSLLCLWLVREPIRGGKENALQDLIKTGTKYERKLTWNKFYYTMKHNKSNRILLWQGLVSSLPWGILFVFLNDYLSQERGFSVSDATYLVAIFGIGCACGGIIGGYYGQVIQMMNRSYLPIFMSVTTILGIIPFVILFNTSFTNAHSIPAFMIALFAGLIASLPSVNVRPCILNVNPPETRSAALTAANLFIMVGRGFGPSCITLMVAILHVDRKYALNVSLTLFWLVAAIQLAFLAKSLPQDQDAMESELASYAAQRILEARQHDELFQVNSIASNDNRYQYQTGDRYNDTDQVTKMLPEETMITSNREELIGEVSLAERMTSFDDVAAKETLTYVRNGILELPLSPLFYRCVNKDSQSTINFGSQQFDHLQYDPNSNTFSDIDDDDDEDEVVKENDDIEQHHLEPQQFPYIPTLDHNMKTSSYATTIANSSINQSSLNSTITKHHPDETTSLL